MSRKLDAAHGKNGFLKRFIEFVSLFRDWLLHNYVYNFFITATITTTTSTAASTTITLLSLNQGRPEGGGGEVGKLVF